MDKIELAIERIKDARRYASQFDRRLVLAYSGGKDSDVLLDLAIKSGVEFEVKHNHTTADAPDTVYHIREVFERLNKMGIKTIIDLPPMINIDGKQQRASMWNLIQHHKSPPTRIARYCCRYLKERNTDTEVHLLLGIRWAESRYRQKRGVVESLPKNIKNKIIYFDENDDSRKLTEICTMKATITTNPIIDWSDDDIWGYIKQNEIKMNPLYAKDYKRVGCIGCPMSKRNGTDMEKHFPKYKELYIRAFGRAIEARKRKGLDCSNWMFADAETLYKWWTYKQKGPTNQIEEAV
jgi:phosphoadenosine phosphosulfate reductase